jgi:glyoxylase-like metal-dependent hydrolase (beta-lactamase superfamily II)
VRGSDVARVQVSMAHGSGPEGGNSAWVLPDPGVVIDPGPPGDTAYEHLEAGIEDAGLAVDDVEHVLVTHWHADHAGLAPRLAATADASLCLHERDAPLVADYAAERERRLERDAETLARWGVPEPHFESLRSADAPSPLPDSTPVDALADGDTVGPLEVLHTPGHTAGHAAFVPLDGDGIGGDAGSCRGFVGDALLRTVTPNVGGGDTRQDQPLAAYRRTLDRLESTVDQAHPGHGTPFELAPRVAELREHHRERAEAIYDALAERPDPDTDGERGTGQRTGGGATPWAIATERFGEMTGYHVKFGAGEAFAHLADLTSLGFAERVRDDPLEYHIASPSADHQDVAEALAAEWETETD